MDGKFYKWLNFLNTIQRKNIYEIVSHNTLPGVRDIFFKKPFFFGENVQDYLKWCSNPSIFQNRNYNSCKLNIQMNKKITASVESSGNFF